MTTTRFHPGDRVTITAKDALACGLSGEIVWIEFDKYMVQIDGVNSGLEGFEDADLEAEATT